jgi:hypothetical protein
MTFQIEDPWASPYSRFTGCYKRWCDIVDISSSNNLDAPDFFTWIKETFPEIIKIETVDEHDYEYLTFKYTFESEAHFTWFLLRWS